MESKEKAKELFDKMYFVDDPMGNYPMCFDTAKKCALKAVDEIIKSTFSKKHYDKYKTIPADYLLTDYWQEVKQELQML